MTLITEIFKKYQTHRNQYSTVVVQTSKDFYCQIKNWDTIQTNTLTIEFKQFKKLQVNTEAVPVCLYLKQITYWINLAIYYQII